MKFIKGYISIISSKPLRKKGNVRLTTVHLKPNNVEDIVNFLSV